MARQSALLIAVVLIVLPPANAQEPGGEPSVWVSRSKTLDGLTEELGSLHQRLYEAGKLPKIAVENADGTPQETLMFKLGKYYGSYVPATMQRISCLINDACMIVDVTEPGQSPYKWLNQVGDPVVLPDLDLEAEVRWILHEKSAGQNLAELVEKTYGGCLAFDEACRNLIAERNPEGEQVLDPAFEGLVWLPGLRVRTLLDLSDDPELEHELERNLVPNTTIKEPTAFRDPLEPSDSQPELVKNWRPVSNLYLESISAHTESVNFAMTDTLFTETAPEVSYPPAGSGQPLSIPGDSAIEDLEEDDWLWLEEGPVNASGMSEPTVGLAESAGYTSLPRWREEPTGEAEAVKEVLTPLELFEADQQKIYQSISYPEDYHIGSFASLVAVIDTRLDAAHCGFDQNNLTAYDSQGQRIQKEGSRAHCGETSSADPVKDHGTHVTGIIAARPVPENSTHVLHGVNPYARVEAYELPNESESNLEATAGIVSLSVRNKPDVLNLSFEYPPSLENFDPVKDVLEMVQNRTLVVTAAGNDGAEHGGACPYYPACMDLPNIVVVAATAGEPGNPQLWQADSITRSDFGRRVHIAAPGASVPSTVRGNRLGRLSGTSQAAPIVAGAASMIFSLRSDLAPYQVRNRLIYTSDLSPNLEGKLLGGVLNIQRALDLDSEVVVLRKDTTIRCDTNEPETLTAPTTLRGEIISIGDHVRGGLQWRSPGVAKPGWTELDDLRRMVYHPDSRQYTFVVISRREDTELKRFRAYLQSRTNRVEMRVEGNGPERVTVCEFDLQAIEEYVAAMH